MTTDEKLDRLTTVVGRLAKTVNHHDDTLDQALATIARSVAVVETLAGAVAAHDSVLEAHDRQIGALIKIAEKQQEKSERLEREWQA